MTLVETTKMLEIRIEELKSQMRGYEVNEMAFKTEIRKLQGVIDAGSLISEEQYLRDISRLQHVNAHLLERMKERGSELRCSWCGNIARAKKLTIWWNERTGELLLLHMRFCQHFPEPFRDTRAGERGWHRIDPWQVKGTRPRLRKDYGYKIANAPTKQTRLTT